MKTIIKLILLLTLSAAANSLQCYHCNDTFPPTDNPEDIPDCVFANSNDDKQVLGQLITCDEPQLQEDESGIGMDLQPACMLSISVVERPNGTSYEFYMRSCVAAVWSGKSDLAGECTNYAEKAGSESEKICYCTTDECNATPDTVLKGKNPRKYLYTFNFSANIISSLLNTILMALFSMYLL